jgi:Raf kinase inhibitor-like YbhB/YbcL family protein
VQRARLVIAVGALIAVTSACGTDGGSAPAPTTLATVPSAPTLAVTSSAFAEFGAIPVRYTCEGEGVSPSLAWIGVPEGAVTLEIEVTDPDAPSGDFVHWHVTDIPAVVSGIGEASEPPGVPRPNSAGSESWTGPCPPQGDEPHRYVFTVRALDEGGAVLAAGATTGVFSRG